MLQMLIRYGMGRHPLKWTSKEILEKGKPDKKMVYSFGEVFNGFNKFCEEKTLKLRQSFSISSPGNHNKKCSQSTVDNRGQVGSSEQKHVWDKQHPSLSICSSSATTAFHSSTSGIPASNFVPSFNSSFTQMNIENVDEKSNAHHEVKQVPRQEELKYDDLDLDRQIDFTKMNCGSISDLSRRRSTSTSIPGRRSIEDIVRQKNTGVPIKSGSGMTSSEFRRRGRQMVDYIADYIDNIENRRVVPSIEPGYLRELIPQHAPQQAESFDRVLQDFESYIMPGVTHWTHPRFHAYFPAGNSFPSILADMLSDALGAIGFSWAACPAMTELEMHMLQWFGEMIGLPIEFLPFTENGNGGGVIQGSASECNFVALLAARFEVMKELRQRFPFVEEGLLMSKLIAYCSKEAHSSVEKAALIAMVKLRILETDSNFRMRGDTLQAAISEDRNLGLIPFFVSTTLGTTSCCSFDVLSEIGPVCTRHDLWLHVDAAYAGSAMICPEFRYLMAGIEHAMSFNTNPNKWMLINYDCSTMWVKDRFKLTQALVVDPLYLQHSWTDKAIDYRHWGIPLSRRFRALKLWFVIRMYGIEGLQHYIREHVRLAKLFESLILADDQFEIVGDVIMGLVCFRMKASDEMNQLLLTKLNSSGRIHMVPASLNERFVIRFCVCYENATDRDIYIAYDIIKQMASSLFESIPEPIVENYEMEVEEAKQYDQMMQEKQRSRTSPTPVNTTARHSTDSAMSPFPTGTPPPMGMGELPVQPIGMTATTSPLAALHDRRRMHTLAEKRSFLVRMVSDPKCYNPKIIRHLNMRTHNQTSQDLLRDRTLRQAIQQGSIQQRNLCPTLSNRTIGGARAPFSSGKYACLSIDQGSDEDDYQNFAAEHPVGVQIPM